jgi:hypothetical protein
MKNLILLFFLFFLSSNLVKAQEFYFVLNFEDNAGNRDYLWFGYDKSATDSIDEQFQEINIIDSVMNDKLDVRFSDYLMNNPASFQSKIQITLRNNFGHWPTVSTIEIKCENWPVRASWDSFLFDNMEYNGSVFTSWYPGGWFDCSSGYSDLSVVFLKDQNEVVFTKNYSDGYVGDRTSYLNNHGDSISLYWITLADRSIVEKKEFKENQVKIFPNPANDLLYFENRLQNESFDKCIIYSISGMIETCSDVVSPLNISDLKSGIYYIELSSGNGRKHYSRFIKQ